MHGIEAILHQVTIQMAGHSNWHLRKPRCEGTYILEASHTHASTHTTRHVEGAAIVVPCCTEGDMEMASQAALRSKDMT